MLEEKIHQFYAHEKFETILSSNGSVLASITQRALQYALSMKPMQRLIAMSELIRLTSFKYSEWEQWYSAEKKENFSKLEISDYLEKYNVSVIRVQDSQLQILPSIVEFYNAVILSEIYLKDEDKRKQYLNDYARYLCAKEMINVSQVAIIDKTDSEESQYINQISSKYKKLFLEHGIKNLSVETEFLQLLKPKRFRNSSLQSEDFESRNPFESDYFRIVTSAPIRRLQDKTQIFPQEKSDFVRRRLTHSMEVAAVGRHLGLRVEERLIKTGALFNNGEYMRKYAHAIATILETAGLVHDIGNPPFGHFGEDTIQRYFKDLIERSKLEKTIEAAQLEVSQQKVAENNEKRIALSMTKILLREHHETGVIAKAFASLTEEQKADFTHFDGNVQGFRILRHLGLSADHDSFNVTMPTMAAIIKYPFPSKHVKNKENHSTEKYGYYQSEKGAYETICKELNLQAGKRHPLAYLLEAADDIVNVTSDVEDGFKMGIIKFEKLEEKINKLGIAELNFDSIRKFEDEQASHGECCIEISNELVVKEFRIRAVHALMEEAINIFVENIQDIVNDSICMGAQSKQQEPNPILGNELLKDSKLRNVLSELQKMTYQDSYVLKSELLGEHVISAMLDKFIGCMFSDVIEEKEIDGKKKFILKSKTAEGKLYALISPNYKRAFNCDRNEVPAQPYQRFLLAVDHVSGMTDSYIVDLYNELTNSKY